MRALADRIRAMLNTTLWRYAPDADTETLRRHQRRALAIVYAGFFSNGALFVAMVEGLLSEAGWLRFFWFVVAVVACPLGVLLIVPAIVCYAWARETAGELSRRDELSPEEAISLERLPLRAALKAMLYAAMLIAIGAVARNRPDALAWIAAATAAISAVEVSLFIAHRRRKAAASPSAPS